jgi:hypothetical protein
MYLAVREPAGPGQSGGAIPAPLGRAPNGTEVGRGKGWPWGWGSVSSGRAGGCDRLGLGGFSEC